MFFFFGHLSPHSSRASLHFFFISIRFSLGWVWLSSAVRSSSQRYSVCRRRRWWVMPCDVLLRVRCAVFRIWSMRVRQYATNLTGAKRDVHFLSIYIICTAGYDSIRRTSIGWATRIRLYLQRIWKSDHYAIHGRGRLVVMSYFVARTRMGPANKDDDDDDDRRTRAKKWSVICRFFVVFFFCWLVVAACRLCYSTLLSNLLRHKEIRGRRQCYKPWHKYFSCIGYSCVLLPVAVAGENREIKYFFNHICAMNKHGWK